MDIPDFVGEKLDIALGTISKQYPALKYEIIYNYPPNVIEKVDSLSKAERIVRQRLIDNEKLELVVSLFKEEPDFY